MAKFFPKSQPSHPLLIISFLLILFISFPIQAKGFGKTLDIEDADHELGLNLKKEKVSHFRLYWHDVVTGPSPTSVPVVKPVSNKSPTAFGLVNMIDNPLTLAPQMSSKMVGRAQGFYASACQKDLQLLMAMNFGFMEGKYNGSSITILGRNMVFNKVREMPIIGGSGLFRFARGYVEARTNALLSSKGVFSGRPHRPPSAAPSPWEGLNTVTQWLHRSGSKHEDTIPGGRGRNRNRTCDLPPKPPLKLNITPALPLS